MKKVISTLLILTILIASFAGCGKSGSKDVNSTSGGKKKKLVVWTFTDEIQTMINDYYLKDNPNLPYEIEIVVTPTDNYPAKLDPALASGSGAPDVFALESAFVKKYVNSKYTMDIKELGLQDKAKQQITQYVIEVGTDSNGILKGLSWQAAPGAFFYRRSIAKKYLGSDEPATVQEYVKDFNTFIETGKKLKADSNDKVKMISSLGDLSQVYFASRQQGWQVGNKFVMDPKIEEYFDAAKVYQQEGLTKEAEQWSEGWFASMKGTGDNADVFGYLLPTWGLHYVLKTNSNNEETKESTAGDWAMTQGPSGYFWGGTWLAARQGSQMKSEAAALIEYLTLDEKFLEKWAKDTGDFLGDKQVVNRIKDTFEEPFLGGQNHYAAFAPMAEAVNAKTLTEIDADVQKLLNEEVTAYARGEKDKQTAISDFKNAVKNAFPNLIVE